MGVRQDILARLEPLVGLRLSIARRAADLRGLHFGAVRAVEGGTVGEHALHIQCPWRLDGPEGIVTGRLDLWEPADPNAPPDWSYEQGGSLQDERIGAVLGGYDEPTRSHTNATDHFVVEAVKATAFGDVRIDFSGGYRLTLFPAGAVGEAWRIFQPGNPEPHFVVEGGWAGTQP